MTIWSRMAVSAAVVLLSSCDRPTGPRVNFTVTHTDQLKSPGSTPSDLPPEPAVVQGGTGAIEAHGLIAAPDECDDLAGQVESGDSLLTLRVIVRGSRSHPGGCGGPGGFALIQWQARIEPINSGPRRVRILYDYRGLRKHAVPETGGRDPFSNRVVVDRVVTVE